MDPAGIFDTSLASSRQCKLIIQYQISVCFLHLPPCEPEHVQKGVLLASSHKPVLVMMVLRIVFAFFLHYSLSTITQLSSYSLTSRISITPVTHHEYKHSIV